MRNPKVLSGLAIFAGIAVLASGLAIAQDPIAQRRAIMKSVGAAAKTGGQMVKNDIPFDAKKAGDMMTVAAHGWGEFTKLFPDNSKTGGETTASPKIWENRKDFEARGAVLKAKAEAAATAAAQGADAFKAAYGAFVGTCKGCHENFRIMKN
jgi:cytochrome c556